MISILDSEDMASTQSENHLEDKCVDLPGECNPEVEEGPVSSSPPKSEEINVSKLFSHFLQNRKLRTDMFYGQLGDTQKYVFFLSC